jgi:mRNA-degrading endonuclease RelE of RelBE toxin-antitoxin system
MNRIIISDEHKKNLKVLASLHEKTMQSLLEEILEEYFQKHPTIVYDDKE